jgi:hypothetical protein
VLQGRWRPTDARGGSLGSFATYLCLTAECLWVSPELSIPLRAIERVELTTPRGLLPRRVLRIEYRNPITGGGEAIFLCKLDELGLGFYRRRPLEELAARIEELRSAATSSDPESPAPPPVPYCCEVCGAKPAFYVGYFFLIGAFLVWYQSPMSRRLHCARHNAAHGAWRYLVTALTGWWGFSVFGYPRATYVAGRNLEPAFGRAAHALALGPSIVLTIVLARWFLGR